MSKALIEKAFKFWWSSRYLNSQHIRQAKNAFIAGATWQREQLIKELREAREIIGGLLATAKGYELDHIKDKLYTVRQRIERGDQFLAKLDDLEGEK